MLALAVEDAGGTIPEAVASYCDRPGVGGSTTSTLWPSLQLGLPI